MKFNNKMNTHEPTAQPKNYPISLPSPDVTGILTFSFHSLGFFLNSYITYVIIPKQYIVRLYLLYNFIKTLFLCSVLQLPFLTQLFFSLRLKHVTAVAVICFHFCIVFHCVTIPQFIYPFSVQWKYGLMLPCMLVHVSPAGT